MIKVKKNALWGMLLVVLICGTNLFTLRYGEGMKRRMASAVAWLDEKLAPEVSPLVDESGAWYATGRPIIIAHAGGVYTRCLSELQGGD